MTLDKFPEIADDLNKTELDLNSNFLYILTCITRVREWGTKYALITLSLEKNLAIICLKLISYHFPFMIICQIS